MMRTRLHLKPGQKGTKQLLAQYGDRLVCVRYRYHTQRKKRCKTVELIVAERDWEPPAPRLTAETIVGGCASGLPRWACVNGSSRREGSGIGAARSGSCATTTWYLPSARPHVAQVHSPGRWAGGT